MLQSLENKTKWTIWKYRENIEKQIKWKNIVLLFISLWKQETYNYSFYTYLFYLYGSHIVYLWLFPILRIVYSQVCSKQCIKTNS